MALSSDPNTTDFHDIAQGTPSSMSYAQQDKALEKNPHSDILRSLIEEARYGLGNNIDTMCIYDEAVSYLYSGITTQELSQAAILVARSKIEVEPAYSFLAARLLLGVLFHEVTGQPVPLSEASNLYKQYLPIYIEEGVTAGLLDPVLLDFDLQQLAAAIRGERDTVFTYAGLQMLFDGYLLQHNGRRIELPQLLWMRVAMGLAVQEKEKEARAIEFYELLSQLYFTPSTPTLFYAGTCHPQLSPCYVTTVADNLDHVFKSIRDNALLSKWAAGLGNDWTNVRALGADIKGTNGKSQGLIPFLKIVNDTAVAVNQGGRRKGAVCAYLEAWHLDVEDFLDLRRNTGDDRRRTHDLSTAIWIPDLFMKRVQVDGEWTLFSPDDVADLHNLYGKAFEQRYVEYEYLATTHKIRLWNRVRAIDLWHKILTRLFETGHPWITWKDPSNIRSPQDHMGVIHSSNLCTEVLLNTSESETAVCTLGSVNLPAHITTKQLDLSRLQMTIRTAVRMLDNIIDVNFYPTPEARAANLQHRPIGVGLTGFQDALYLLDISYASQEAAAFADRSMEAIAYYTIMASSELAHERKTYPSYHGSKWDTGLLPVDTIAQMEVERGQSVAMDRSITMDWDRVRNSIQRHGMRNSNVLAIAPTVYMSAIIGNSPSIEPTYKNLYAKSNVSGEFTQVNAHLVDDLKRIGLWDAALLEELKYYNGSIQSIARIPDELKRRYLTAFEFEPEWLIECASRRQKWIDMGQSLNLYLVEPSGKRLHEIYVLAWNKGLKTTYYLRSQAATQIEKSTLDTSRWATQARWIKKQEPKAGRKEGLDSESIQTCDLDDGCDVCQ
jgi:ribonucleoside-diphosphate reductase alpha chain